jgi:hypothetical protein
VGTVSPLESGGWRKIKMRVEIKRHTNAHQPLTSHSPMGVSIPLSAIAKIISKYAAICALLLLCDDYYNKIGKYHNRIQIAVGGYGQSAI